jgi:hypothetical protein
MAGGDALYLLPRGAQQVSARELPPDLALVAIAVEPWPPFRYALAGRRVIAVFSPDAPGDPIVEVSFATPEDDATHLAWTRHNGRVMIYFRGRNGRIGRIRIDEEGCEHLEAPPIAAIASDAAGVMAMISIVDDDADIWVSSDGADWEPRLVTLIPELSDNDSVYLAVSSDAVAFSVDNFGTSVSWDSDQMLQVCDKVFWGPVAFQEKDALFVAHSRERTSSITRVTRQGEATLIAEIEAKGQEGPSPTITALAWDGSRRTLWGASPGVGVISSSEPTRKGVKKRVLN